MTEEAGTETVLIVDDEKSFLLSLKDGLRVHESKFRVLTAESGKEAISLLRALPVDLLITDLKMPEVDGFELLAWTTREKPDLPVIVMTAFGTSEIESQLAEIDSLQYLEKPLALGDLESAIFTALKAKARSYIRGISLATFLQLMHLEKKSCTLKISHMGKVGYLYFRAGILLDAETGELKGTAAAYEIMVWNDAEIEMDSHCRRQDQVITISLEHLLIDAFRRKDEMALPPEILPTKSMPEETSETFSGRGEDAESSPEAVARLKLVEVLTHHAGVKEFALFDPTGFLENRNEGECQLEEFDPALFLMGVERLDETLHFGSFSHMIMNTGSRCHCLLFKIQQHRVVARLVKGQRPAEVMKQVKQALNA
ncbi:response regulator [Geopsychrobacter electrodiphilus]|uniref:response regulator n=1 Tax=Geopsychrobacter electrodiphilus TaxID=225196 RepID=UPI0003640B4B|nr:response regulator [Geopsychrobacter electrodiphilus]